MAFAETVTCDACHGVKGATNHWWMAAPGICAETGKRTFFIYEWDDAEADNLNHYCSQSCACIALSEWMQDGGYKEVA